MSPFVIACVLLLPVLLFLGSLSQQGKRKIYLIVLLISGTIAMGFFVYVQTVINAPDHGKEVSQFYLPLLIYLMIISTTAYRIGMVAKKR